MLTSYACMYYHLLEIKLLLLLLLGDIYSTSYISVFVHLTQFRTDENDHYVTSLIYANVYAAQRKQTPI